MDDFVIEMHNITKSFSGVKANDHITLQLKRGEIHALLGENGAGKSTLMDMLSGLIQPDEGTLKKDGKTVVLHSPNDAQQLRIGMVHQHFKLVEAFSVLDNIMLVAEDTAAGFLKRKKARQRVAALSEKYGLMVDPNALIKDIPVGMRQRVEILKMLYRDSDILILDEPTAVLTPQEIHSLMILLRSFASEGKTILFATRKPHEIMNAADRCTVLRQGRCMGTVDVKTTPQEELSRMMTGRAVPYTVDKKDRMARSVVLEVRHMTVPSPMHKSNAVRDVSLEVRAGEIVCLAGIEGNGQREFVQALTGLEQMRSGRIRLNGKDISRSTIRQRSLSGISYIPEDRHQHGLILDYTLEENLVLQRYFEPKFQHNGLIDKHAVRKYAHQLIEKYDIHASQGAASTVRSLSDGDQQKAVIGREIDRGTPFLLAVQPTCGLDTDTTEYIRQQLIDARDAGCAVLLVSPDPDEIMQVADRILVMYKGELVGELGPQTSSVQELGLYMAGTQRQEQFGGFITEVEDDE